MEQAMRQVGQFISLEQTDIPDSSGIKLNVTHEEIYFVKVTKTADSKAEKESVDFYINKW